MAKTSDSPIYFQDDRSPESGFRATPRNDPRESSVYSFDRSTPHLHYSGSLSFEGRYLDTSQSTPRHSDWPGKATHCSLTRGINPQPFLDVGDCRPAGAPDLTGAHNTGRSSTCNVTVPCELEPRAKGPPRKGSAKHRPPARKRAQDPAKQFQLPRALTNLTSKSSTPGNRERRVHRWNRRRNPGRRPSENWARSAGESKAAEIDLESQNTMEAGNASESFLSNSARDLLIAPEFASDEKTRRFLSLSRELYVAIVGCQLVFVLTSLLFGNVALAIIVTLLLVQSCFCHSDGRPVAYLVNAILSLAIGVTVMVALAQDVSGLEPFRTEPVLKTLSYVYLPISFLFTLLSIFLAYGFARLHRNEKRAIVEAANSLLGAEYAVDAKSLLISKQRA